MQTNPLISVVMPVHNAAAFLEESIHSILQQSYTNFEFIIIDDASNDQSIQIINRYALQDTRIKIINLAHKSGVSLALNQGLNQAQGKYIARMDADDISIPSRISQQVDFMEANPQIDVCGSWAYAFKGSFKNPESLRLCKTPIQHQELLIELHFKEGLYFLLHPTVFIRQATLEKFNLRYNPLYSNLLEDRELWYRMSQLCRFANVAEPLVYYRLHPQQTTLVNQQTTKALEKKLIQKYSQNWIPQASPEELELHAQWQLKEYAPTRSFIESLELWLLKIHCHNQNTSTPFFPQELFSKKIGHAWFTLLNEATHLQMYPLKKYIQSPLSKMYPIGFQNLKRFTLDCLWKQPSRYLNKNIIH